ncbi:MAG: MvaI/BcnI family restriction endonuclease [Calditrichota bacterium]
MMPFQEIIDRLSFLKEQGFIRTHRSGNTGIGKTLEDLLGIEENNFSGPNAATLELKSGRKNVNSLLTLFTKSPDPPQVNSILLENYGYKPSTDSEKKKLHTTVNAIDYNSLKGGSGFKIGIQADRINLLISDGQPVCYWLKDTLKQSFERKLPNLLYVKAEARGQGRSEEFWFNEAWVLSGFSFNRFVKLIKDGIILIDIRIGQYSDGRIHDHGTAFRIKPDKLDECFKKRLKVF